METLWQDLKYGVRQLARNPGFTAVAVLTLALGIGANTTIFSVVNGVLLRPLPFPEPDRLVWFNEVQRGESGFPFSAADFLDYRAQNRSFEHVAAMRTLGYNLSGADRPERIRAGVVSPDFFPVFKVKPLVGRTLLPQDGVADAPRVAVLSHAFWQQHFAGDASLVGKTIRLNDDSVTVVGVMPPDFKVLGRDLWVNPRRVVPEVFANTREDLSGNRAMHYLLVAGRLKPGVTLAQAQGDVDGIARRLQQQNNSDHGVRLVALHQQVTASARPALLLLLVAVGLVLLITCANVANLLLARATVRSKEVAIRSALGASRARVIRQLLTESLLLALVGGTAGLLAAPWGVETLVTFSPQNLPRASSIRIDGWVLLFTLGVSMLTGVVFGLAPGLTTGRMNLNDALKEGGRAESGPSGRGHLRSLLIVSEIGLSLVLLTGAGLLLRSFMRLLEVKPGFNPENLVTLSISFSSEKYGQSGRTTQFVKELLPRLESLPGVSGVAIANDLPLEGQDTTTYPSIEGRAPGQQGEQALTGWHVVNPGYFQAMGIPLLKGRNFTDADREGAAPVVVVNQTAAQRLWPGEDPIGKRLRLSRDESMPWLEVVGLVGDVKHNGLDSEFAPDAYTPIAQTPWPYVVVALRTESDTEALARAVRAEVLVIDADMPVFGVRTMNEVLRETVAERRFTLAMTGLFAALALLLAAVGLYGVMAYLVNQRSHEIGVRRALGAHSRDIFRLVIGQGITLTLIGIGAGLLGAFALTRFLASLLFGIAPRDPLTFIGVPLLLVLVAALACWVPARRAMRVDPMTALRYE